MTKENFANELRSAVDNMCTGYERVMTLVARCQTMGWTADDFATVLTSEDLTPAQFFEAIECCATLAATFSQESIKLQRLRP